MGREKEEEKPQEFSQGVKVLLLVSLIPLTFSVPYILSWAGELVLDHQIYLVYLWIIYALIHAFIFFKVKSHLHTLNSFVTQILKWGIFAMGAYSLVDIPRFLDPKLRQVSLYCWLSFTILFNIAFYFIDDTNYIKEEEKEKKKDQREADREKKRIEKKKKKLEENPEKRGLEQNPIAKKIINVLLYALFFVGLYYLYLWSVEFQEKIEQDEDMN